jgi:hypothetical protein
MRWLNEMSTLTKMLLLFPTAMPWGTSPSRSQPTPAHSTSEYYTLQSRYQRIALVLLRIFSSDPSSITEKSEMSRDIYFR